MPPDTSKTAPTPSAGVSAAPDAAGTELLQALTPVFDAAFATFPHIVLAVSGGSDSTALMHLAQAWRTECLALPDRASPPTLSVMTVDHRLRSASAAEATAVAEQAQALGLPQTTLVWDGPKPTTGIQAAAREARFDLIRRHLSENAWPAVAMAHTADDQAETVLMRLARGSGIDGLAAMRSTTSLGEGQTLLRPLLGVPKSALTAYLTSQNIRWIEDPSNQSPGFERVRLRQAQAALMAAGITLDNAALARTAARAARASDALSAFTAQTWAQRAEHASFNALGIASVRWDWLLEQPEDIRLRLLAGLIEIIGGQGQAVSLGQLEAAVARSQWGPLHGVTLHGAQFVNAPAEKGTVLIIREYGRPMPELEVAPGQSAIWDGRFSVRISRDCPGLVRVSALGSTGLKEVKETGWTRASKHTTAVAGLWTQPAVWWQGGLAAAPTLGFARPPLAGLIHCEPIQPRFASKADA